MQQNWRAPPPSRRAQISDIFGFAGSVGRVYFLISSAPPARKTPEINRSRTVDAPGYFYFILSPNNRGEVFGKSAKTPKEKAKQTKKLAQKQNKVDQAKVYLNKILEIAPEHKAKEILQIL